MDLHAMDGQPGAGIQLLVTDVTLVVLGFLMLDQDLLVIKFTITIPGFNWNTGLSF